MSRVITKFRVSYPLPDQVSIEMPAGAEVLSANEQYGDLCIWAAVDPGQPVEARRFLLPRTGFSVRDLGESKFVDTVLLEDGASVIHVFDRGPECVVNLVEKGPQ